MRLFLFLRNVERDGGTDQLLERRFLDRVVFPNVDGPSRTALEARVEQTRGVFQRRPLIEGQLDDLLVGFARADAPVVGPDGSPRGRRFLPLPLLDDVG